MVPVSAETPGEVLAAAPEARSPSGAGTAAAVPAVASTRPAVASARHARRSMSPTPRDVRGRSPDSLQRCKTSGKGEAGARDGRFRLGDAPGAGEGPGDAFTL